MATDREFIEFVVDQLGEAGPITSRKMFGEYCVYADQKVIALVCDNRLFMKPTEAGRAYAGDVVEAPPYPGAKPYFLIEGALEDREWVSGLARITAANLPAPVPKAPLPLASREDPLVPEA
jgi:TfoX/Sxy family transcriptional regulator of competence genes